MAARTHEVYTSPVQLLDGHDANDLSAWQGIDCRRLLATRLASSLPCKVSNSAAATIPICCTLRLHSMQYDRTFTWSTYSEGDITTLKMDSVSCFLTMCVVRGHYMRAIATGAPFSMQTGCSCLSVFPAIRGQLQYVLDCSGKTIHHLARGQRAF